MTLKISRDEAAGYVCDILTGKLAPRQYKKSKEWYLDLGSVAIECNELPNYDTEELARLAKEALEEFVVEDDDPDLVDPPRFNGHRKFTAEELARSHQLWLEHKAAAANPKSEPASTPPVGSNETTDDTPDRPVFPEPGGNQLEIFIQASFRHCDPAGVVNLRSFHQNDANKAFRYKTCISLKDGLKPLIEAAVNEARRAAKNPEPINFCPPVATFKAEAGWHAREEDLLEGPVFSVELDENPRLALAKLEQLLGPPTLVVRSGGTWTNPETNAVEDKLHAYWRLKEPARGEDLIKLKRAREIATNLVNGDHSNIPINHPIRWPGSWHRKSTPRVCEIISPIDQLDNEIDLDVALATLEDVTPQSREEFDFPQKSAANNGGEDPSDFTVAPEFEDLPVEDFGGNQYPKTAEPKLLAAALTVIPNSKRLYVLRGQQIVGSEDDPLDWNGWVTIGMATWNGTSGSVGGFAAFDAWSKKSPKYNARTTGERWEAFSKCPPTRIGAGTIFFLADKTSPDWREEYKARGSDRSRDGDATNSIPSFNTNIDPPPPLVIPFRRHGERPPLDDRAWAVEGFIPEVGTGVIAGQWGMLKTFVALDLAQCIMTGRPFINQFNITRPGGVLMFALEGQSEVPIRIQGVLEQKGNEYHKGAPFYWCEACPPLINSKTAGTIIATAKAVAAEFKQRFNLPLTLILIDSLIAGAGYTKEGQDNDAVLTHAVKVLADKVSRAVGCFVFIIDHFGKDVSTGTRGSSVKEVDAEVIVACLGKRSEAGEITNSSLAMRKRRAGPTGEEFPFKGRIVDMGLNPQTGRMETTLVIDWNHHATVQTTKKKDDWGRSKSVKLLRSSIMNLLVDCGQEIKPFPNGPTVRALKLNLVEAEFLKSYAATGDTEKAKKDAKRKAFQRALDAAGDKIATREISGIDYIWLVNPAPRKPPIQAGSRSRSDNLPYTGPVVEMPNLGPDSLDEHGAPQEPAEGIISG